MLTAPAEMNRTAAPRARRFPLTRGASPEAKRRAAALALLSLTAYAVEARADDSNFRRYLIGGRAGGMGGAFTALADDGSGPYYNPGGMAFVQKSQVSLSASVYGLVNGSEAAALGDGHDFNYTDLNIFPVSTSSLFKLGDAPAGEIAPHTIAISVFVPDAYHADNRASLTSENNQNAVSLTREEQTLWAGAAYAHRFGPLGVGVGAYAVVGTSTTDADLTAVISSTNFATLSIRNDLTVIGLVASVGLRWDVTEDVHVGLSFFTPELGLYGSRSAFVRAVAPPNQTAPVPPAAIGVVNQTGLHASATLPLRAQAGLAFRSGRLTVAGDAIVLGALETVDDAGTDFERRVVRNAVVNGSLGAEWLLTESVPLRAGAFTDFAASPMPVAKPPGQTDPNPSNTSHVDRYGGTVSLGYRTEHTATDVGVIVSYGAGSDLQAHNFNYDDLIVTRSTQTLLYAFLSSAYRF